MPFLATLAALTLATAPQDFPPPPPPPPGDQTEMRTRVMILNGPGGEQGLDADDDGFVTRQEFAAPLDRAFAGLDKDGDGKLSKDELEAGSGPMGEGGPRVMRWSGGEGGHGPGHEGLGHEGPGAVRDVRVFTLNGAAVHDGPGLDADNDGRVTEDEFLGRIRDAFRRMDKDGSGALEAGEREPGGSDIRIITRRLEHDGAPHAAPNGEGRSR